MSVRELGYDSVSGQWRVLWQDNLLLLLGKTEIATINLERWLQLLPYFARHKIQLANHIVDLRYPDGFAYSKY